MSAAWGAAPRRHAGSPQPPGEWAACRGVRPPKAAWAAPAYGVSSETPTGRPRRASGRRRGLCPAVVTASERVNAPRAAPQNRSTALGGGSKLDKPKNTASDLRARLSPHSKAPRAPPARRAPPRPQLAPGPPVSGPGRAWSGVSGRLPAEVSPRRCPGRPGRWGGLPSRALRPPLRPPPRPAGQAPAPGWSGRRASRLRPLPPRRDRRLCPGTATSAAGRDLEETTPVNRTRGGERGRVHAAPAPRPAAPSQGLSGPRSPSSPRPPS